MIQFEFKQTYQKLSDFFQPRILISDKYRLDLVAAAWSVEIPFSQEVGRQWLN